MLSATDLCRNGGGRVFKLCVSLRHYGICVSAADQHNRGVSIPCRFIIAKGSWKLDILSHKHVIECMGEAVC